jgi:hypothetical protein
MRKRRSPEPRRETIEKRGENDGNHTETIAKHPSGATDTLREERELLSKTISFSFVGFRGVPRALRNGFRVVSVVFIVFFGVSATRS